MDTNLVAVAQAAAAAALQANSSAALNTIVVSVVGFLGVVVTTVGTVLLAKINQNAKDTKIQSMENGAKADKLMVKTEEIHTATNSNLTKMTAALEVMTMKDAENQKLIGSLNQMISALNQNVNSLNQRIAESDKQAAIALAKLPS